MGRILLIASYTPSLINFRGPLIRSFLDRGHEVVTCSPSNDEATIGRLHDMGVAHHIYPLKRTATNPISDYRTYQALKDIIRQVVPTHTLAYTIKPVVYGCLAAHSMRVPHIHAIISGLGTSFQSTGIGGFARLQIVQGLYRKALSNCESVMFQNPDDQELFIERGLVSSLVARLTNGSGIDLCHFQQHPIVERMPRFLLIARLINEKGVAIYAEAAKYVKAKYPEAEFRLVGYFEDHPDSIRPAEVKAWEDSGTIVFLGQLDDVRTELAGCSVYCLPSYYREGVPRSVLEALATGRPIITTDATGCRETVTPGINGWLVPQRDHHALAKAMMDACQDREQLARMGEQSRMIAESKFDVDIINSDIAEFMKL